jgi:hypothetical protein
MRRTDCKSKLGIKENKWDYIFVEVGSHSHIIVCLSFICDVLKITKNRLEVIKNKIIAKKSFADQRGKHIIRPNKLSDRFSQFFDEFLSKIPKVKSHYTQSNKSYFENTDLNLTILFTQFQSYIKTKSLDFEFVMSYDFFRKFFHENYNLGFKHPRTDVCDFHYEYDNKKRSNTLSENEIKLFEIHVNKVESYKSLKSNLLKANDIICFEFDYSQNRPLPKLPNCDVFYKRLIWFHIFNVHLHNLNISYMFHYLEGKYPKNPNSVCSYIFHVMNELKKQNIINDKKELIFFSDATCSQNRCWTVTRFCSFLSIIFNINITQIFPVRGHSFCICDSNFSLLGRKIKKIERIENPKEYVELLNDQKKFIVIEEKVYDFENFLMPYFNRNTKLKISKAVKISYFTNGDISMQETYSDKFENTVNILNCDIELVKNIDMNKILCIENTGLNPNKEKDLLSLFKYLTAENQNFYTSYIRNLKSNDISEEVSDSSDDEF